MRIIEVARTHVCRVFDEETGNVEYFERAAAGVWYRTLQHEIMLATSEKMKDLERAFLEFEDEGI